MISPAVELTAPLENTIAFGVPEVRVIQGIEEFRPDLELEPLRKSQVLEVGQVQIGEPRTGQYPAACIPVGSRRR